MYLAINFTFCAVMDSVECSIIPKSRFYPNELREYMDAKAILDELLKSSSKAAKKGVTLAEEKFGVPEAGEERDAMLAGMSKGALTVGAIALLLGTGGGRKLTGAAVKLGGIAALGGLAYKSFNDWQSKQGQADVEHTGTPIDKLDQVSAEHRANLLVSAMIAASRVDGHIDADERQKILKQISELDLGRDAEEFLRNEVDKPIDPAALASGVDTIDTAIELYLVSAMVIDEKQPEEKQYLERLARSLQLSPSLVRTLEKNLQDKNAI